MPYARKYVIDDMTIYSFFPKIKSEVDEEDEIDADLFDEDDEGPKEEPDDFSGATEGEDR